MVHFLATGTGILFLMKCSSIRKFFQLHISIYFSYYKFGNNTPNQLVPLKVFHIKEHA